MEWEKDGVFMIGNDQKDVVIHGEQGRSFMVGKLNIFYNQSCADTGNEEVKVVSKDNDVRQLVIK
jgi:hypothetical protein